MTGGAGPKTWTYAELGALTYAQLRNEVYKGGTARPGPAKVSAKGARQLLDDFKAGKLGGGTEIPYGKIR